MKNRELCLASVAALALALAPTALGDERAEKTTAAREWNGVDEAFGKPGNLEKDGTYKVILTREDIRPTDARGTPLAPGLGFGSEATFAGRPDNATVLGELCLLPAEVNPVIDELRAGALEVVALHAHAHGLKPEVLFIHLQGRGEAARLAQTIRAAWDHVGKAPAASMGAAPGRREGPTVAEKPPRELKPRSFPSELPETPGETIDKPEERHAANPLPAGVGQAEHFDATRVRDILRCEDVERAKGIFAYEKPRRDAGIEQDGVTLPAGAGFMNRANFQPTGERSALVMGAACCRRDELQPAIDALRKGGLDITAIVNHDFGTKPEVIFVHYMGEGDPLVLARAIKAAWDGGRAERTR
jgi:hypothetical protein